MESRQTGSGHRPKGTSKAPVAARPSRLPPGFGEVIEHSATDRSGGLGDRTAHRRPDDQMTTELAASIFPWSMTRPPQMFASA